MLIFIHGNIPNKTILNEIRHSGTVVERSTAALRDAGSISA